MHPAATSMYQGHPSQTQGRMENSSVIGQLMALDLHVETERELFI